MSSTQTSVTETFESSTTPGELILNEYTAGIHECYPKSYTFSPLGSVTTYWFKKEDCSGDTPPLPIECRTIVFSRES
jgi:hypothetical protein